MSAARAPEGAAASAPPDRTPRRVRHELRFRLVEVVRAERLTPGMVRVTLGGADLKGFDSPGFDDHVKLFFPDPATGEIAMPQLGANGPEKALDGPRPTMRDYTPRHFDIQARTLTIDFAVHDAGPATTWALQARPGQRLGVGGPRGSFILPVEFDWHLLIGDDTALPAIARRLAQLPAGARAVVLAEVDSPEDELALHSAADVTLHWVHRRGAAPGQTEHLLAALRGLTLPAGEFHAWVAAETGVAKALRSHLVGERGAEPKWTKAAGYWRHGSAATHDAIEG
ncbi:NADPH-dependent ferric siderophore reductase [Rhodoferax koreense]|uniref:NADPH-dependent ferric siderophore reductase n=1 Tax=Rhodoferax koreensis TaxID=1842727 RepID=A0A1P8JQ11_9BURK|nr:siderophore-interacting protein [Rhodoferax koreense]APW35828.1 NADPH-dependent ferric siderophore reductase [Rhodoferax koreense]